jgi:hypothetical protein
MKNRGGMERDSGEVFKRLISDEVPEFEDLYRIYSESIHPRERKPKPALARLIRRPDYRVTLLQKQCQTIGFSILFTASEEGLGLLEYMAVAAEHRNAGSGRKLFLQTMNAATLPGSVPLFVLLEVDSVRESGPDLRLRDRRQQFYRRLSCRRVEDLRYILPLHGEGPAPEMDLFLYKSGGMGAVSKAELKRWLGVIYQRVYNCSPDDPRIEQMLKPVSDPIQLV